VKRNAIWDAMMNDGFPEKNIRLIMPYYEGTRKFVRSDEEISKGLSIDEGVRQGYALLPI